MSLEKNMEHKLFYRHERFGTSGAITPICTCGWQGQEENNHNDWQLTNLRGQFTAHVNESFNPNKCVCTGEDGSPLNDCKDCPR